MWCIYKIKAEKKNYANARSHELSSETKAKPPAGPRPVSITQNLSQNNSSSNSNYSHNGTFHGKSASNFPSSNYTKHRNSTPPRMPADPGSAIDDDFLENWDEESPNKMDSRHRKSPEIQYPKRSSIDTSGVRADNNWLEENFDED